MADSPRKGPNAQKIFITNLNEFFSCFFYIFLYVIITSGNNIKIYTICWTKRFYTSASFTYNRTRPWDHGHNIWHFKSDHYLLHNSVNAGQMQHERLHIAPGTCRLWSGHLSPVCLPFADMCNVCFGRIVCINAHLVNALIVEQTAVFIYCRRRALRPEQCGAGGWMFFLLSSFVVELFVCGWKCRKLLHEYFQITLILNMSS